MKNRYDDLDKEKDFWLDGLLFDSGGGGLVRCIGEGERKDKNLRAGSISMGFVRNE